TYQCREISSVRLLLSFPLSPQRGEGWGEGCPLASFLRRVVILGHFGPVHDVPESLQIVGPLVLVLEVICVFPDITAENRFAFATGDEHAHDGIVLIGGGDALQLAAVHDEPDPAAAETPGAAGFKFFLEGLEATERGLDVVRELAGWSAARLRA